MAKQNKDTNAFVKLAGVLGGVLVVIIIFVLIFAKEQIFVVANTVVWAFVVLGVVLGAFILKAQSPRQKRKK